MNPTDDDSRITSIRPCHGEDVHRIMRIINRAAEAYRGVIPPDRWHEPYMPLDELESEIRDGVAFSGFVAQGELVGVMGVQPAGNVRLIRHAYVLPEWQGHGVGSRLLAHLHGAGKGPVLIGTWAAADWAIRFYRHHGFALVPEAVTPSLLRAYWTVPERQIATSVVLAAPALSESDAAGLIARTQEGGQAGVAGF